MSIKQDINYALFLLVIEELDNSFNIEELNELDNNYELIKVIFIVLSSSCYLISRTYNIVKSNHW